MKWRTNIAKITASTSRFCLQKILRRPGGFYPGKLALKIQPNLIEELSASLDAGTILVTGTNGKTSVTALLARCAQLEGLDVCWNSTGANLASGIAAAMLEHKGFRRNKNFGVFEIDELWAEQVLPQTKSKFLLLLNLFPDQIDRFGSIKNIQKSLVKALNASKNTVLIYNADDPNCQVVADECENNTIAFGINDKISNIADQPQVACPMCKFNLRYTLHQYAQLGIYRCPNCGFNRATPKNPTTDVALSTDILQLKIAGKTFTSKKAVEYAAYNLSGFITAARAYGFLDETIDKVITTQKAQTGRMQTFEIAGKHATINLAKNPVGFNQNINFILNKITMENTGSSSVVAFFANAREGDGRDPSWIQQVDFAKLSGVKNLTVFYGGEAKDVLSEALKNANINAELAECAKDTLRADAQNVYIVANYTAMFPLQKELSSLK